MMKVRWSNEPLKRANSAMERLRKAGARVVEKFRVPESGKVILQTQGQASSLSATTIVGGGGGGSAGSGHGGGGLAGGAGIYTPPPAYVPIAGGSSTSPSTILYAGSGGSMYFAIPTVHVEVNTKAKRKMGAASAAILALMEAYPVRLSRVGGGRYEYEIDRERPMTTGHVEIDTTASAVTVNKLIDLRILEVREFDEEGRPQIVVLAAEC